MAEGDMILNLDFGSEPVKRVVTKFKGGNWRERSRVNKRLQENFSSKQPSPSKRPANPLPVSSLGQRRDAASSEPPLKRLRVEAGVAAPVAEKPPTRLGPRLPDFNNPNVTSSLFTSNPQATTDFRKHADTQKGLETVAPSNAPLSPEAANFLALGLSQRLAHHLSVKLGLKAPTAVQKSAVPQLVGSDSDAFLQAETGSGKTLAYLLPIVQRIGALSHADDGTPKGPTARIHRNSGIFAVVLAPTRELCRQIAAVLEKLLRCAPWIVCTTVIGGESRKAEKARIRKGVNILVATPGRLADHLDHTKVLDLGTVRWLVMDEGDRLMEMGFEAEVKTIVAKMRQVALRSHSRDGVNLAALPQRRVTVLCSATMKPNVQKLGEISLEDALHIQADRSSRAEDKDVGATDAEIFSAPSQLKQFYVVTPAKLRLVTLLAYLKDAFARNGSVMKAIVFMSCTDSVDFHFSMLRGGPAPLAATTTKTTQDEETALLDPDHANSNISKPTATATKKTNPDSACVATTASAAYITSPANPTILLAKLHGNLAQPVRTATLKAFARADKQQHPAVLFTTDISSRGLDVPAVDLVIEFDPAFSVADHVHRIGRTARAGRPGKAVLFLMPGSEEEYVSLLEPRAPGDAVKRKAPRIKAPVSSCGRSSASSSSSSSSSSTSSSDEEDQDDKSSGGQSIPPFDPSTHSSNPSKPEHPTTSSSTALIPLSYETVLQKGLATPITNYPVITTAISSSCSSSSASATSWTKRAETLQLHLEQRLLPPSDRHTHGAESSDSDAESETSQRARNAAALHALARRAFTAHVRAYATHVKPERHCFDLTSLQLGHVAKAFALRDAPKGIGSAVARTLASSAKKTMKNGRAEPVGGKARNNRPTAARAARSSGRSGREGVDSGEGRRGNRGHGDDSDDDDDDHIGNINNKGRDATASDKDGMAQRMREKVRIASRPMNLNGAGEFNIG